jgi:hypothetical protein
MELRRAHAERIVKEGLGLPENEMMRRLSNSIPKRRISS